MHEIINILMTRDDLSEAEAWEIVNNCQEDVNCSIRTGGTLEDIEDAIQYWLGLEPDYVEYFLEMF